MRTLAPGAGLEVGGSLATFLRRPILEWIGGQSLSLRHFLRDELKSSLSVVVFRLAAQDSGSLPHFRATSLNPV